MDIKELKKEIKRLKKSIKDFPPRSKEKREAKTRIMALKAELKALEGLKDEKKPIIKKILRLDKVMASINIDLTKHSLSDLKKYLKKLNEGD